MSHHPDDQWWRDEAFEKWVRRECFPDVAGAIWAFVCSEEAPGNLSGIENMRAACVLMYAAWKQSASEVEQRAGRSGGLSSGCATNQTAKYPLT